MKKYIIIGVCVLVYWLGFSYRGQLRQQRGEQLVTDAYYGDLIAVKNDVEQGAPLEYVFTFEDPVRGYTVQSFNALQAAASSGNEDVILFLLDQGFNINAPTAQGWTPLFIAARDGRAEAAKLFVFRDAELNLQTNLGTTALTMVVTQPYPTEKARLELLEYMLKRGADPNIEDIYHHTALYYATEKKQKDVANLLRKYGAQ